MNTKTILIIFIGGIVVVGTAVIVLLNVNKGKEAQKGQNSEMQNVSANKPESASNSMTSNKVVHTEENVELTDKGFNPPIVDASQGVIVKIKNLTTVKKTIIAGQGTFDISIGDAYTMNFDSPGSFEYINSAQKDQVLNITVK